MAELIDLKEEPQLVERALLVGIRKTDETQEYAEGLLDELGELVKNLGIGVVGGEIVKLREVNPHYLVGSGKFKEILEKARQAEADCIVLDDELSPAQQRNWEREAGVSVVNRQEIILDIFAQRAQTKEARLQVELAKLEYSLPRLRKAWSHLSRQRGGGVTQRGEGESQLELDRRIITEQITKLKSELANVRTMRGVQRKRRMRIPVPGAAIVGYTNAGKSSLINKLANVNILAADMLFATLDPTTRKLELPNGMEILLTDTVGFIRKLPHRFVEAFKATLEEALVSDFLIHVVDSSSLDAVSHVKTTLEVLKELGADEKKVLTVMNKCDLPGDDLVRHELSALYPDAVWISVKSGEGLGELTGRIEGMLAHTVRAMHLFIPHADYKAVADLHNAGSVTSQKTTDDGVDITANVPLRMAGAYEKWIHQ